MKQVRFLLIGGFLGAGKTTTIARLARHYTDQGLRVGLVTNDQAYGLVDTHNLRSQGFDVGEVPGACFCCKFDDLIETAAKLGAEQQPDVILAEPVGSCTDLSATVMQPLQHLYGDHYQPGPLAVLCKPEHGRKILGGGTGGFSPQAAYIFLKQLEEAQVIVLNKIDRLSQADQGDLMKLLSVKFPDKKILGASGTTGKGFSDLIAALESNSLPLGDPLEIDYDTYAEGEAALGWLNSSVVFESETPWLLDEITEQLVDQFSQVLLKANMEPGHIKVLASAEGATAVANWVSSDAPVELSVASKLEVQTSNLLVNARAHGAPEELEQRVRDSILAVAATRGFDCEITSVQYFRPGRPEPVHRYKSPQG